MLIKKNIEELFGFCG